MVSGVGRRTRVLDSRVHWRHLANTVKRLCASAVYCGYWPCSNGNDCYIYIPYIPSWLLTLLCWYDMIFEVDLFFNFRSLYVWCSVVLNIWLETSLMAWQVRSTWYTASLDFKNLSLNPLLFLFFIRNTKRETDRSFKPHTKFAENR